MINSIKNLIFLVLFSTIMCFPLFYTSCTYDNIEDLFPVDTTIEVVSYINDVQPILEVNCYSCHSGNFPIAGFNLDSYQNLVIYVENGKLLGAINHEDGFKPMPEDASKLSENQINIIRKWIENGYPDN